MNPPNKKTAMISLTVVAMAGPLLGAPPRQDPCGTITFTEDVCEQAIQDGGYFWYGKWVRMKYSQPYPYYYDLYQQYLANQGLPATVPPDAYDVPAAIRRGGFGSTGVFIPVVG
jgi:hypothetical protein